MSNYKKILRDSALNSLQWARKFRESGDDEYFAKAIESFRRLREDSKDAA